MLEKKIEDEEAKAKAHLAKKRQKQAMECLKRKKMFETQLQQQQASRLNLETMRTQTQQAQVNQEVFAAQRAAQQQLAANTPSIDDMQNLRDEMEDALAQQQEISELLQEPLGEQADDDDLMAELEGLQGELDADFEQSLLPDMPTASTLPDPNKTKVEPVAQEDEVCCASLSLSLFLLSLAHTHTTNRTIFWRA